MYKTNTSGCSGVSFETKAKKYRAYIHVGGVKIPLGYYVDLDSAISARKSAEFLFKGSGSGGELKLVKFFDFVSNHLIPRQLALKLVSFYFWAYFNTPSLSALSHYIYGRGGCCGVGALFPNSLQSKGMTFCGFVISNFNFQAFITDSKFQTFISESFKPFSVALCVSDVSGVSGVSDDLDDVDDVDDDEVNDTECSGIVLDFLNSTKSLKNIIADYANCRTVVVVKCQVVEVLKSSSKKVVF